MLLLHMVMVVKLLLPWLLMLLSLMMPTSPSLLRIS